MPPGAGAGPGRPRPGGGADWGTGHRKVSLGLGGYPLSSERGWTVLEAGSISYGKATSYLPVIELLRAYCQMDSRDDEREVREKLVGKLLTLDRALEPTLPAFFALLDLPIEDPDWQALDPPQRTKPPARYSRAVALPPQDKLSPSQG